MLASVPSRPPPVRSFTDAPTPSTAPPEGPSLRYPHVRATLNALAKTHKPLEHDSDDDDEHADHTRVTTDSLTVFTGLLDEENDEGLQTALKDMFGVPEDEIEQYALDLMHAHKNDIAGVPFLFVSSQRRPGPISRPSSRASSHSTLPIRARPETPVSFSVPSSPLASLFRRAPLVSPSGLSHMNSSSYITSMNYHTESPSVSPVLAHASLFREPSHFTSSLPSSPLQSPRLLNAKANEFRPGPGSNNGPPRPLSRASSYTGPGSMAALRAQTPSPDLWSTRNSSNLAIAAPLLADGGSRVATPSSSLRSFVRPEEEDDNDPFDPFSARTEPLAFPSIDANHDFGAAVENGVPFDMSWSTLSNSNSNSSMSPDDYVPSDLLDPAHAYGNSDYPSAMFDINNRDDSTPPAHEPAEGDTLLTDGMTPFDVLSSVFGTTLAPSELEEALAASSYDFDKAMAWLIERALPEKQEVAPAATTQQYVGGRVTVVSRAGPGGGVVRGGRGVDAGRGSPRFMTGRNQQSGRVCRYFLAGECLRADCRFSHDLERALCRFWLRGTCAKGEQCEFLHHLPENVDVSQLSSALQHTHIGRQVQMQQNQQPVVDEFPVLGSDSKPGNVGSPSSGSGAVDPSRTRFAAAVKKGVNASPAALLAAAQAPKVPPTQDAETLLARRHAMGSSALSFDTHNAIIAPRPSPRIRLRPPTLLPTLPTGGAMNQMYMQYRQRALQLGAARNACLSRAADAWRRGDGASAKRFSREGAEMNRKMKDEMGGAARRLVVERNRIVEEAVRAREAGWSSEPADRGVRGRSAGKGLGVMLGVAAKGGMVGGTVEERTECVLDLHGLHANEATEILEEFLMALEHEHFYGLAFILVGEEKHTGTQDPGRGASRHRLATAVREFLHQWGYPWVDRDGIICVDPLTNSIAAAGGAKS